MKKKLSRIISVAMAIIMVLSLLTMSAFAETEEEKEPETVESVSDSTPAIDETEEKDASEEKTEKDTTEEESVSADNAPTEEADNTSVSEENILETDEEKNTEEKDEESTEVVFVIKTQPVDVKVVDGTAEFVIETEGNDEDAKVSYQWQKKLKTVSEQDNDPSVETTELEQENTEAETNKLVGEWMNLENENSSKLIIKGLDDADALAEAMKYSYRCVASCGDCVLESSEVSILEDEVKGILLSEYLATNGWSNDTLTICGDVTLDDNLNIGSDKKLVVKEGCLTVPADMNITNDGLVLVNGGALVFEDGAKFNNNFYTIVEGTGTIQLNQSAIYDKNTYGILMLDHSKSNDASVDGISCSDMEYKCAADSADALKKMLSDNTYSFTTIVLSNPTLLSHIDGSSIDEKHAVTLG